MNINHLWKTLQPPKDYLESIKEDYKRGITPYLPYFVVNQNTMKSLIGKKIHDIDKPAYLNRALVIGDYGNGKTNLLRYLQLYCDEYGNDDLKVSYWRADIDKPDIFLTLLYHIENNLITVLLDSIKALNSEDNSAIVYKSITTWSKNVTDYSEVLQKQKDDDVIKKLIYLGTGRFYSKKDWNDFDLKQKSNFDRREILCLFLNILSLNKRFIIFEIDEIERIRDKSKARFFNFLTTFRELLDMANHISGHLLLVTMTLSAKDKGTVLGENPAFASRINNVNDIAYVDYLNDRKFQEELIREIGNLLSITLTDKEVKSYIGRISRELKSKASPNNRALLQEIFVVLEKKDPVIKFDFFTELDKYQLLDLYNTMKTDLDSNEEFKNIDSKIFEPLRHYLSSKSYTDLSENLKYKDKLLFIPEESKLIIWNFSDNTLNKAIESFLENKGKDNCENIILMKPTKVNFTSEYVKYEDEGLRVIEYDPEVLFTLLELYSEYSNYQTELDSVIIGYLLGALA